MTEPIRVLVVDDHKLVREGILSLLALSPTVDVVGDIGDGADALRFLDRNRVDVILLDLRMPGLDGIATLRAMRERRIEVPVLVLTTFDDDDVVFAAIRAGARGYLCKDVTLDQLLGGIHSVAAGATLIQPALTDRLLRAIARSPSPPTRPLPDALTDREVEVLRLAANGWSNRKIADALYLAEGTVKNHMSNVLLKLGVRDRTKAVLTALTNGILGPEVTR